MRALLIAAIIVVIFASSGSSAQVDSLTQAILACGAWCEAAVSNQGIRVEVVSQSAPACEVDDRLLAAEAEASLRRFGHTVDDGAGHINGSYIKITLISVGSAQRCSASLHMLFAITRYLDRHGTVDNYYADIIVDEQHWAMAHPASQHTEVLRKAINEQSTVWANELVRRAPTEP